MSNHDRAILGAIIAAAALSILAMGWCGFNPNDLRCLGAFR